MVFGALLAGGIGLVSSALSGRSQRKAADRAADAQVQSAQLSIDEQRRQFDQIQELLAPFIDQGTGAFQQQGAFLGLQGQEAQQAALQEIERGPQFQQLMQQGENAILQNASATGGLRGGNTQGALAQYRPQVLNDLINQRFAQLGGIATMGQNAATMQGTAGQSAANAITGQLTQMGQAQAGSALARGQASQGIYNAIGGLAGKAFEAQGSNLGWF